MANKLYSINLMMVLIVSMSAISQTQGKAILITHVADFKIEGESSSSFKTNVWYYGDVSIQEVPKLYMKNDSSGQKNYFRVNYYLLINPTLEKYAYYKHFSDTARPVIKYNGSNPPFSK